MSRCRKRERSGRFWQSAPYPCSAQVLAGTLSKGVPLLVDPGETDSDPGFVRISCPLIWTLGKSLNLRVSSTARQFGIADRWKCTICQSESRFAMTNVTRPLELNGVPSRIPVMVSKPVTTTTVSDKTMTE